MADVLPFDQLFYTAFEPKHKHRFLMGLEGLPGWMIKGASRPNFSFTVIELDHINLKRKIKGKASWESMTCTLYDPIVPSASQTLLEWIRLSHEATTGRDGYADFYKKDVDLWMLGPVGDIVEHWKMKGAWVNSYDGGQLEWSDDGVAEISISIAYDYAELLF